MSELSFLEIINYKGKQIMFWSYPEGMTQEELVATLNSQIEFVRQNPQYTYLINDIANLTIGTELMEAAKENSAVFEELKIAVLGVTGIKKFLLWSYNSVAETQVLPCDTKEEALEYLIND